MSKEKGLDKDYKLIPMSEITDEAREIAIRWYAGVSEIDDIQEKHKLASDIMNYARRYASLSREWLSVEDESCKDNVKYLVHCPSWKHPAIAYRITYQGQPSWYNLEGFGLSGITHFQILPPNPDKK